MENDEEEKEQVEAKGATVEETEEGEEDARGRSEGVEVYNATIAGCDRSYELRAGNLGTVYVNLRGGDAGGKRER